MVPCFWDPFWDHTLSGTALRRGGRGHRTGAPDGPSISGVPSPEAGPNPPCCHQASRCGPAPAPARVRTPRPALFVVGCCSPFVRPDHHYLLLATATAQPAGAFHHCVRAGSSGPNGIHCRATTSASRPADRNDARDCSTPDNSDWTTNMVPPSTAAPTPNRTADPEPDAPHRRRRPGGGRNHLNGVPAHRHIGPIADADFKRPGGQRVG
jgi:hypothetical protein